MLRILVVDDEPDAVVLLEEFLTAKGYDVLTASNGEEALQKAREAHPHAMLLDVRMPRMNGLEVLRRVREFDREMGIIMVTAVADQETTDQALQMGAFDYISKPMDFRYLEQSLWIKLMRMSL